MDGVQHGGALDRAIAHFGGRREDWLDLSTGINPNPYPVPNIPGEFWHRLPDEDQIADCLAAARQYYAVTGPTDIVAAPGTQSLIQLLPRITEAKNIWIVGPTYNEYERVFSGLSTVVVAAELPENIDDIDLVVVGCPNNPDGRVFEAEHIARLGRDLQKQGGFVLVDAAFGDVLPIDKTISHTDGVVVFRSFGKFFGLAGLRLGFAIGSRDVLDRFRTALGPWAVSGPALYIGAIALRDQAWINGAKTDLSRMRSSLEEMVQRQGFDVVGATDLFVTCSNFESANIAKYLAENNILARTFDANPHWIRFGLPANSISLDRLEKILAQAR